MPDKATEVLEQMLDQRLKDITEELRNIRIIMEGYKSAAQKDVEAAQKLMSRVDSAQQALSAMPTRFMSGRWPLRDGDSYGTVAPQPTIKLAEPVDSGDDKAGDLRSLNER